MAKRTKVTKPMGPTKAAKPSMTQTTMMVPDYLLEAADQLVMERGGTGSRSVVLREFMVAGFRASKGEK